MMVQWSYLLSGGKSHYYMVECNPIYTNASDYMCVGTLDNQRLKYVSYFEVPLYGGGDAKEI